MNEMAENNTILKAENPVEAAQNIVREMEKA